MARTRRSDEELKIGLEHLLDYELDQMERLAYVLASNITGCSVLTNAMLEAFVLHFRCILSFYTKPMEPSPTMFLPSTILTILKNGRIVGLPYQTH